METCATVISNTDFPSLLKELQEEFYTARNLRVGFRKADLHPLLKDSIYKSSLALTLPTTSCTTITLYWNPVTH